jgi:hypothetical protein
MQGKTSRNAAPAYVLLRRNFWKDVPAHSITKIPLPALHFLIDFIIIVV